MVHPSLGATGRGARVLFCLLDGSLAADRNQHRRTVLWRGCGQGQPDQSIQIDAGRDREQGRRGDAGGGQLTANRAAITGIVLLLIAALGVVSQLKDAMNTIWNVEEPKEAGVGWYLRTYLVSFAGILSLGFLLAVSLVISTGLAAFSSWTGMASTAIGEAINFVASLAILTALFAMLFKWFPDTEIAWRDVLPGAVVTALLFNMGKFAIGWYIGTQGLESTYGAAASIVILLVWVYYSAQIVLFGAELTHAYATEIGSRRVVDVNAELPHKAAV
jgi:YihY family inner membrane protein